MCMSVCVCERERGETETDPIAVEIHIISATGAKVSAFQKRCAAPRSLSFAHLFKESPGSADVLQ